MTLWTFLLSVLISGGVVFLVLHYYFIPRSIGIGIGAAEMIIHSSLGEFFNQGSDEEEEEPDLMVFSMRGSIDDSRETVQDYVNVTQDTFLEGKPIQTVSYRSSDLRYIAVGLPPRCGVD